MADNAPEQSGTPGSAPGEQLHIPKHRFDEVSNEVKRLREEMQIKDRLLLETQSRMNPPAQPRGPSLPSAEDLGLDPQTYKAVSILAEKMVESKVAPEKAMLEQQIGILSARTEKAELLAAKGADKEKYLPEIQRRQQEHFRATGGFMPAETALKLIQADESESRIKALEAKIASLQGGGGATGAPAQTHDTPAATGPGAGGTRELPSAGGGGGSRGGGGTGNFSEMTVEDMERTLEEQFKGGQRL